MTTLSYILIAAALVIGLIAGVIIHKHSINKHSVGYLFYDNNDFILGFESVEKKESIKVGDYVVLKCKSFTTNSDELPF